MLFLLNYVLLYNYTIHYKLNNFNFLILILIKISSIRSLIIYAYWLYQMLELDRSHENLFYARWRNFIVKQTQETKNAVELSQFE